MSLCLPVSGWEREQLEEKRVLRAVAYGNGSSVAEGLVLPNEVVETEIHAYWNRAEWGVPVPSSVWQDKLRNLHKI